MESAVAAIGAADVIKAIRSAEEEAARIVAGANREAADMLKGVEEAVHQDARRGAKDNRAMIVKQQEDMDRQVEAEIAEREERQSAQRAELSAEARTHMAEAARFIFERVVAHGEG